MIKARTILRFLLKTLLVQIT